VTLTFSVASEDHSDEDCVVVAVMRQCKWLMIFCIDYCFVLDISVTLTFPVASEDHSDEDCVVVAVMTHGERHMIFGTDKLFELDRLVEPLRKCETLFGKPKIFLVQAVSFFQVEWTSTKFTPF
jgi:hypothetical protein